MSRGTRNIKRHELAPDSKYGSVTVTKMINYVMENGKKTVATKIVYTAIETAAAKLETDALTVLETAIKNVTPVVEVRGRRVGGANLQVPIEVPRQRRLMLALRWLLISARAGLRSLLLNSLLPTTTKVLLSVRKMKHTVWPKQTVLLHTSLVTRVIGLFLLTFHQLVPNKLWHANIL
jgi:small subunit ribosomal protein S7